MKFRSQPGPATRAIHTGACFREETGAVIPPVFLTSTFAKDNPHGFDYTRSGNPNFRNLEETLASLENAKHAVVFASGVSAMTAVVAAFKSGDLIFAEENLYGCTYRLFEQVFRKFGLRCEYADFTRAETIEQIKHLKPRLVWLESPTNPLLKILDLRKISEAAEEAGADVLVDNTFASPVGQQPLDQGLTLSLSSTTKYISGHSDVLGGVVCTNDEQWHERLLFSQKALGLQPSPFDCWLISRGVKTLAPRMRRHDENASACCDYLQRRDHVRWVRWPHHPSHPQHDLARRQMKLGSGIVTSDLGLSNEQTMRFLGSLKYFTLAESLGGVESLVCHPASMTHASVPRDVREKVGITDSVVRFSLGIEDSGDLLSDLEQAFQSCGC